MFGLADKYLERLGLPRRPPDRAYLDALIEAHLRSVPYETCTKILDTQAALAYGGFLPPHERAVERILGQGAGGTCWVLTRTFNWLLRELGFDVAYLMMDPGHLCLSVALEGEPFYADVAYAAPVFRAMPLRESFRVEAPSEVFSYTVVGETAKVVRTPGPEKVLGFAPWDFAALDARIAEANHWETGHMLKVLSVSRASPEGFLRLVWGTLKDYRSGALQETVLGDAAAARALETHFGFDPAHYFSARALLAARGITGA